MNKLFFITLFVLFLAGCKDIKEDIDSLLKDAQNKIIVVLVDFSKSIPEPTINWYNEVITNSLFSLLNVNDKLVVLPVDQAAQTSGVEIFSIYLDEESFYFAQDPPNQKHELIKRRIKRFLDTVTVNFTAEYNAVRYERVKYANRTDLIGALKQAVKYFDEKAKNYIVVLSDMIQDTEELNLEVYLRSKPNPTTIINNLLQNDFQEEKIFILTGNQPKIGIKDFNWLKDFWTTYINKNNGQLITYETGGVSLLKEKLK